MSERLREWRSELVVGGVTLLAGFFAWSPSASTLQQWFVLLLVVAAVMLCRRMPGVALSIAWFLLFMHVFGGVSFGVIELAFLGVAFGVARWGSTLVLVLSGASLVAAGALLVIAVSLRPETLYEQLPLLRDLVYTGRIGTPGRLGASVAGVAVLTAPWLLGLALRFADRASRSRVAREEAEERADLAVLQSEQAQEIARLQEQSASFARDVHDVVGHSLAVILAQAESGQFLPDDDPARLKATLATIADSARGSLRDVRAVLADDASASSGDLELLLDGIRSGGREVLVDELGTPRPLPPEVETTAFRTMQEMLTNAVKYGDRDAPIRVERLWPDEQFAGELRLEVSNHVAADAPGSDAGRGLAGMRQRLEAIDGRLDVRRRVAGDATSFTVTAWLPVSRRAPAR